MRGDRAQSVVFNPDGMRLCSSPVDIYQDPAKQREAAK